MIDHADFYILLGTIILTHVFAVWEIQRRLKSLDFKVSCIAAVVLPCKMCGKVGSEHTQQETETCGRAFERRMALERKAAKTR